MKKVVVTGATSMMGIAVIKSLLFHNVERIYAVIQPNSIRINRIPIDDRIVIVECSCDDYKNLATLINDACDTFYHFAWQNSTNPHDRKYYDVDVAYKNIGCSLLAFEAAKDLNVKKFVGAGSQAEYGLVRNKVQSPSDIVDPKTTYAIAKDTVRRLLQVRSHETGIILIWVRIFSIYGVFDRENTMISSVLKKLLLNVDVDLTECMQVWDYLFEDDAGEALFYIARDSLKSNVFCLGSGEAKPLKEYVLTMKDITGSSSKLNFGAIVAKDNIYELNADINSILYSTGWQGPSVTFEEGIKKILQFKKF